MSDYGLQCCLMGDILIKATTTVSAEADHDGDVYSWTVDLRAGTWFATPNVFWQYVVSQLNAAYPGGAGENSISLDTDPDSATYGKMTFTVDTGWGSPFDITLTVDNQEVYTDLGMSSSTITFDESTPVYTFANPTPLVLTPVWPPTAYDRGVDNLTGNSERAHDGTVYSTAGSFQEKRRIGLALDRREQNFDEIDDFLALWKKRWCRGRAVTFYLDRDNVEDEFLTELVGADVLVLPTAQRRVDFSRLMPYKEFQDRLTEVDFAVRTPLPATETNQSSYLLV